MRNAFRMPTNYNKKNEKYLPSKMMPLLITSSTIHFMFAHRFKNWKIDHKIQFKRSVIKRHNFQIQFLFRHNFLQSKLIIHQLITEKMTFSLSICLFSTINRIRILVS